ncbi:MAG: hypothetical protein ACI9VR_001058 [Cognaticolwellia sp.]|jgi:hypothetical protein
MLLLAHALLLQACTPAQEAPQTPAVPEISDLVVRVPSSAKVGDKITVEVSYTLPAGCWRTETELSQPSPLALVLSTLHVAREQDCVTGENSSMTQIPLTESGALTWTVVFDGKTVAERTVQVEPAE